MPVIDVAIPAYNVADTVGACLDSVLGQRLPSSYSVRVYVTDDCSEDNLGASVATVGDDRIKLLQHLENRGRSAACNTAIRSGNGEIVVVMDADCRFADRNCFNRLIDHFDDRDDAVLGTASAEGDGFWAEFARHVAAKRIARARSEGIWHMTTAAFAIRRSVITELGGFSEQYRRYGFEDRDLLIRLSRLGAKASIDDAFAVFHRGPNSVEEVCDKMLTSGRYSAPLFAAQFPEEYRTSAYRRFDIGEHPTLARFLLPALASSDAMTRRVAAATLAHQRASFSLQALALRCASALAYLHGTALAARDCAAIKKAVSHSHPAD